MSEGKPGTEARTYRVRPGAKTIMEPGKAIHPHSDPPSAPVRRPWRRAKLILAKNVVAVDIVPLMNRCAGICYLPRAGKMIKHSLSIRNWRENMASLYLFKIVIVLLFLHKFIQNLFIRSSRRPFQCKQDCHWDQQSVNCCFIGVAKSYVDINISNSLKFLGVEEFKVSNGVNIINIHIGKKIRWYGGV